MSHMSTYQWVRDTDIQQVSLLGSTNMYHFNKAIIHRLLLILWSHHMDKCTLDPPISRSPVLSYHMAQSKNIRWEKPNTIKTEHLTMNPDQGWTKIHHLCPPPWLATKPWTPTPEFLAPSDKTTNSNTASRAETSSSMKDGRHGWDGQWNTRIMQGGVESLHGPQK